ncbi:MAG: sigma-70 family RNA polymerase sigma factor [Chitinivibrionales bacterium]|nr:sigma-70 family RNA polymerase sigma factor [Chitinivibrionales bacterium]
MVLFMKTKDSSLMHYLAEIGKEKNLSSSEEALLSSEIRKGNHEALTEMIVANLRFVVSVAKTYKHQGLPLSDLVSEGNIGLIRAAGLFDESRNVRFISFAVWRIRQAILRALADQSRIVRVPAQRVYVVYKIGRAVKKLEQKLARYPDIDEIADETGMTGDEIKEVLHLIEKHLSLEAPVDMQEDTTLFDILYDENQELPDENLEESDLKENIRKALGALSKREQEVLRLYFGLEEHQRYTLGEIGKRFNLTCERARQIKERALLRVRRSSYGKTLKAYIA